MSKQVIVEKGIMRLGDIDANHILSLLQKKHELDVFVPECRRDSCSVFESI
jgi:hypothetical protein